jgi:hypothetical protein
MTPFEEALAIALDRCGRGESAESVAADFPEHDLLPYIRIAEHIRIAERIHGTPSTEALPSSEWMQRSLHRLLTRKFQIPPED